MGCASSKLAVELNDVYRPPPASVAYFDIDTVGEPWLTPDGSWAGGDTEKKKKPDHLPVFVLDKVDGRDDAAPKPWPEVRKALEDLKPTFQNVSSPLPPATTNGRTVPNRRQTHIDNKPRRSLPSPAASMPATLTEGLRPVSQNCFLLRDRQEKQNGAVEEDRVRIWRRDPFHGLPEICPPGGANGVVLYTTSLRAVRRTFEDCETARRLLCEVEVDERDVCLHGKYLEELRELVGEEEASVPRLFVLGRYVGGAGEAEKLNEVGRLRPLLRAARRRRRIGGCEGCGGARFVPCSACRGSRKAVVGGGGEEEVVVRCGECNENGLVMCPRCN